MKAGWQQRSISEIAEIKGGKRLPKGEKLQSEPTAYPYLTVGDFTDDGCVDPANVRYVSAKTREQIKPYIIRTCDVYVSIAGTIGRTGIVPDIFDGAQLTENACRLVLRPEVYNRFIYYFTKSISFTEQAIEQTRTAAQPKLALSRLGQIKLALPPLDEQQRIVAVLDKAFAAIAIATVNAQKNLTNARALFERGLSDSFQNDDAEVSIGSVAKFVRGPFGGSLKKNIFQISGFAVYEQQHAIYDQFTDVRYFVGKEKFVEMERFQTQAGDIIMSCSGTIGRVALVPEGAAPGIINQALLKLSPSENTVGEYLLWYMRSDKFRAQISARSGGAALQNVASVAVLKEITFPLPHASEQLKIVSRINALKFSTDRLADVMKSKLAALSELKQSLLQKAFAGELT